ncbi:hypothetical protein Ndes2526B_g06060 [Nannochloris sp. 'desiccata']
MPKSSDTLLIENLSSQTRSSDIKHEMNRYGRVIDVERDIREKIALCKFKKSGDAKYAWRKADGTKMDGKSWRVDPSPRKQKTASTDDKQANLGST